MIERPICRMYMPRKAREVLREPSRYKVLYGGRGSAKSHSYARRLITLSCVSPLRVLCTREMQNSIKDSVHRLLTDVISELKLDRFFTIQKDSITSTAGSEFIFKGLRHNISEIKSLEGVDIVWVEEAEKVPEDSWQVLTPTIRKDGSEIWVSFNPDDEKSATYTRFVEKNGKPVNLPDCRIAKMNFRDNDFFPEVLRREMEYDKVNDPDIYEHVWEGMPKKYSNAVIFKGKIFVEDFEAPDGVQFRFGADFGYAQDPSSLIRLFIQERTLFIDHEAYGVNVELEDLHAFFATVPGSQAGWKITADSSRPETISMLSRQHIAKDGTIYEGFNIEGAVKGKGSVEDGIQFLRKFERIVIHPRCTGTIKDFENYRWKQDRITNEILPIPVDKSNHSPDACIRGDVRVTTSRGLKKIKDVIVGDLVFTREGFKPVYFSGITRRNAELLKLTTVNGLELIATPDHRIYKSGCFVRLDALRYGHEILTDRRPSVWQRAKSLFIKARITADIQSRSPHQNVVISQEFSKDTQNDFIERSGKMRMARYQINTISIIKTVTLSIMRLKTLNASLDLSICQNTGRNGCLGKNESSTSKGLDISRLTGIDQQKVTNGIKSTALKSLLIALKSLRLAIIVAKNILLTTRIALRLAFAQSTAKAQAEESPASIKNKERVRNAKDHSSSINTPTRSLVPDRVLTVTALTTKEDVYDISVQGCPEFFAGGILVHNCRYALEDLMKGGASIYDSL